MAEPSKVKMPSPEAIKATTKVAIILLIEGAVQMTKRKLTENELKTIGSALGWLILVTNGTKVDLLKAMDEEVTADVPTKARAMSVGEDPTKLAPEVEASGGKRRLRKKMRGGAPSMIAAILGAIGIIFGANQGAQMYQLANHRDVVRASALQQVRRSCPAELSIGPPAKPVIDWKGEYAVALSNYETLKAKCKADMDVSVAQVREAEAAIDRAWQRLPAQAATLATAASVVAAGPVTPATVTAAMTVGKAVHTLTSSFVSGSLPVGGAEFSDFVNTVAAGFPSAAAAAEEAPAGDGGVPAAAAPAAAAAAPARAAAPRAPAAAAAPAPATWPKPPAGGRRKTKKSKGKRRVTRRRAPAMIKFAY
jgi:hypothetical protein